MMSRYFMRDRAGRAKMRCFGPRHYHLALVMGYVDLTRVLKRPMIVGWRRQVRIRTIWNPLRLAERERTGT